MDGLDVVTARALRIVLMGDGAWAAESLRRLRGGPHTVAGVVVRARPSDETLSAAARCAGIPVLQPADINADESVRAIAELRPDLLLSIAYNQILRRTVLDIAMLGCVNVHAGKLPSYRGRNVINWAIINGEPEIGITTHLVDEGIDTGDILVQRMLPIAWTDTYGHVLARVVRALPDLVMETVDQLARGQAEPRRQSHLPGTYFSERREGDEWLDWSAPSAVLHNFVRGISRPGPGARTMLGDEPVIIWRAFYDPLWPRYRATPGQVVGRRTGEGVLVKTGDSTLLVQEVQVGDERPVLPTWPIGTRLGARPLAMLHELQERVARLEAELARRGVQRVNGLGLE
ncbi:MAG TPA: methionyl-tRNA formyltransferase [Gemmatimonadaceae bacterium]